MRVFRTHSLGYTSSTNFDSGFLQRGASYSALRKKYKPLLEPLRPLREILLSPHFFLRTLMPIEIPTIWLVSQPVGRFTDCNK